MSYRGYVHNGVIPNNICAGAVLKHGGVFGISIDATTHAGVKDFLHIVAAVAAFMCSYPFQITYQSTHLGDTAHLAFTKHRAVVEPSVLADKAGQTTYLVSASDCTVVGTQVETAVLQHDTRHTAHVVRVGIDEAAVAAGD